jgi:hypothetical protein
MHVWKKSKNILSLWTNIVGEDDEFGSNEPGNQNNVI